jgi:hypothetical protein
MFLSRAFVAPPPLPPPSLSLSLSLSLLLGPNHQIAAVSAAVSDGGGDAAVLSILTSVCALFALIHIYEDAADFELSRYAQRV